MQPKLLTAQASIGMSDASLSDSAIAWVESYACAATIQAGLGSACLEYPGRSQSPVVTERWVNVSIVILVRSIVKAYPAPRWRIKKRSSRAAAIPGQTQLRLKWGVLNAMCDQSLSKESRMH